MDDAWGDPSRPAADIGGPVDERLGRIVALMAASKVHRPYSVADLERLILPSLLLGQAWVAPRSFGTWAWLTAEAEAGFVARTRKLRPGDLAAGSRLWVVEFAAPFGGAAAQIRAFKRHLVSLYGAGTARWTRLDGARAVRRVGRFSNEGGRGAPRVPSPACGGGTG